MGSFFSKPKVCHETGQPLAPEEVGKYSLIPFDGTKPEESNDLTKNGTVYMYSKAAFERVSVLDFTKTYDVVEPTTTAGNPNGMTLVMVHGGGASRSMYSPHAKLLSAQGYRCILPDLPGHGTLTETTTLTLESCTKCIGDILETESCTPERTIYVGASLGAYVGFSVLSSLKDKFVGAVLMDCGQNVGPDCSVKARLGLWMLSTMASSMSNHALMNAMVGVSKKSPAKWKLVESTFGAGMFFQQARAQVECLHSVEPAQHIPQLNWPILFMNGSLDHRDSENKWLSLCNDQEHSALQVYEGGDHFFTHDERFVEDILERIDTFAKLCAELATNK